MNIGYLQAFMLADESLDTEQVIFLLLRVQSHLFLIHPAPKLIQVMVKLVNLLSGTQVLSKHFLLTPRSGLICSITQIETVSCLRRVAVVV